MKTKIYSYISILFLGLCSVSCEGFLEETNKSGLTSDPFMTTKVGIESALNSCYSGARTYYGQEDGFGMTESVRIYFCVAEIIKLTNWQITRLI